MPHNLKSKITNSILCPFNVYCFSPNHLLRANSILKLITPFKKMDFFQFSFHGTFFCIRHILKRGPVFSQIQTDQFHNSFSTYNISAITTNHIDHSLRKILQLPGPFQIPCFPGFQNTNQTTPVIICCSSDSSLCSPHSQAR